MPVLAAVVLTVAGGLSYLWWRGRHPSPLIRLRAGQIRDAPTGGGRQPDVLLGAARLLAARGHRAGWLAAVFDLPIDVAEALVAEARRRR